MPEPTATAASLLATPEAFRGWLAGKPANEQLPLSCYTLEWFLFEMTGIGHVVGPFIPPGVGEVQSIYGAPEPLPAWVNPYVCEHDRNSTFPLDQDWRGGTISVAAALQALDRATATGEAPP